MAPFLRLLVMTLVIVVGRPLSALGCSVVERVHRQLGEGKTAQQLSGDRVDTGAPSQHAASKPSDRNRQDGTGTGRTRSASVHARVGDAATSTSAPSGTLRRAAKARGVLFSLLSQALAESAGQADDEFDSSDTPDLVDDECPQGYANIPFPGLSLPTLAAPDLAQNLWGIQPSMGHPHGDYKPPRV